MSLAILGFFALLVTLLLLGFPVFLSLGITGFIGLVFASPMSPASIPAILFNGVDKFILTAIPFFVLMGNILVKSNSSAHLINFLRALVGHLPGGLMVVSVSACIIFAALTGTVSTGIVAVGAILIPAMIEAGYQKRFSLGAIAAGSSLGVLIPPSISMIIYGDLAEQSVGKLFMAGVGPGLLAGGLLMLMVIYIARRDKYVPLPRASWAEIGRTGIKAIPIGILPVIILGGLYGGYFSPTEAAAVAALISFLVAVFLYKSLPWEKLKEAMSDTARLTSMIYMIVATAGLFGVALTYLRIPQAVTELVLSNVASPTTFIIYLMILILIMGCFLDAISIIYITVPLIVPLMGPLGINPILMGVLVTMNIEIGALTPPVGLNLFVVAGVGKSRVEEVIRGILPFILVLTLALILVLIFPQIALYLPSLM